MKFTKMHGLGNDYVFLDCCDWMPDDPPDLARKMSDRHFGVGSDGLILICKSESADFSMRMYNADGSEGTTCGNGIRCMGKYLIDKELAAGLKLTIETKAGVKEVYLRAAGGGQQMLTVDMGVPQIKERAEISVKGKVYTGMIVSVGNPHFVVSSDDVASILLADVGPLMEAAYDPENGVNVEFVQVLGRDRFAMRVWERGSGETMACGSGACAAAAALVSQGMLDRKSTAVLPGGELELLWRESDGRMLMTGPAVTVFEGEWYGSDQ